MSGPSDWPLPKDGVRFIVPRLYLKTLQSAPISSSLYLRAVGYYPKAKGHVVRRTRHNDDLILYCLGGEGTLQVDGNMYAVRKGDLMMLPQGLAHLYVASDHNPWTLYWIHFGGHDVPHFWSYLELNQERPVAHVGTSPRLTASFQALSEISTANLMEHSLTYGSALLREILTLIKLTKLENDEGSRRFSIDAIHGVMQQSLHTDLNLDTLAQTANMTTHAFCRRYKAITGVSPYKHYLYLKMKRACHFLDATDQSIGHIAELMGYSDPYYFSRLFKQVMGMPPTKYRRKKFG